MNQTKYLVDNNALVFLRSARIQSDFFSERCFITADVLWEASGSPDVATLQAVVVQQTPEFFSQLRVVMSSEPVGDISLVDLYRNKGMADPGLLAAILQLMGEEVGTFFPDEWLLVTTDRAVLERAECLGVQCIPPGDLAALIDGQHS